MNQGSGSAGLDGERYLSLESFRKNGAGVRTPVWFAAAPAGAPRLYVYSTSDSGKAKRIRRNGAVRIAPCDARGTAAGAWIDARATIAGPEEFQAGMALLNRKYWPWKQMLGLFARLGRGGPRVVIAIQID